MRCWTSGSSTKLKPRLRGRAFEVRYADDAVLVFDTRTMRGGCLLAKRLSTPASGHADGAQSVEVARGGSQLRDVGVHPLLGTLQEGAMGGEAQNGQGPISPMANGESARASSVLSRKFGHYAYYGHRERSVIGAVRHEVRRRWRKWPASRPRVLSPCGASRPQCVPAARLVRGAGCLNWASPDLWEPRVGNFANPTYDTCDIYDSHDSSDPSQWAGAGIAASSGWAPRTVFHRFQAITAIPAKNSTPPRRRMT